MSMRFAVLLVTFDVLALREATFGDMLDESTSLNRFPRDKRLLAAIFDVDGVLVASPHERAWREALVGYANSARFTTDFYQAHVAGKPRLDGARCALEKLGVPNAAAHARTYAEKKQALIDQLIAEGNFKAFPDAVRLALALKSAGLLLALASSSKNVGPMLRR